jgi:hypothetical protein
MCASADNTDPVQKALQDYEREQREFENHWLWKELRITPQEFFEMIERQVQKSGIEKEEWERRLAETKKMIETRMREQRGQYEGANLKRFIGLRA